MIKENYKIDIFIYLYFFIVSFCKGLGFDFNNKVYLLVFMASLMLCLVKIIKTKYTKKEILNLGLIVLIGIICLLIGNESTILFSALSLLMLKKSNLKDIIKAIFVGRAFGFLIMFFGSITGIIDMNEMLFYRSSVGGIITRYSFGYNSPNLAHSTFNIIVMLWLYLCYEKINIFSISILFILNYIFYNYTFSRTGFYIMSLFLIIIYLSKKSKKIKYKIPKLLNFTFVSCIVLSFVLGFLYGKVEFLNKLNEMLSGRINYLHMTMTGYFPKLINNIGFEKIIFDNGYFDLIYKAGIIPFAYFFIMQIKTNNYLNKKNYFKESIFTLVFFIYCILESYYASIIMNIPLLFMSYVVFNRNYGDDLDEK